MLHSFAKMRKSFNSTLLIVSEKIIMSGYNPSSDQYENYIVHCLKRHYTSVWFLGCLFKYKVHYTALCVYILSYPMNIFLDY